MGPDDRLGVGALSVVTTGDSLGIMGQGAGLFGMTRTTEVSPALGGRQRTMGGPAAYWSKHQK